MRCLNQTYGLSWRQTWSLCLRAGKTNGVCCSTTSRNTRLSSLSQSRRQRSGWISNVGLAAGWLLFDHDDGHCLLFPQVRWSAVTISGRSSGDHRATTAGHGDPSARQEVSQLWAGHGAEEEEGRKWVRRNVTLVWSQWIRNADI